MAVGKYSPNITMYLLLLDFCYMFELLICRTERLLLAKSVCVGV